jgi:hypothetical protein
MASGKTTEVIVRTTLALYVGTLHIPQGRNRTSDLINDPHVKFLNLTNVRVDDKEELAWVCIHKAWIESIQEL